MGIVQQAKSKLSQFMGMGDHATPDQITEAKANAEDREEIANTKLTPEENRFVMRCGVRSSGGQKILSFLARGTRVNDSPAANVLLGAKYRLY